MSAEIRIIMAVLLTLLMAGCGKEPGQPKLQTAVIEADGIEFTVEMARTEDEQSNGLMRRTTLGELEGMIFIYGQDKRMSFWMKDTSLPLSIAFLSADGTITQIEDMKPLDPVGRIVSRQSVRYALEVNRGAFERHGIREGDKFSFPEGFPYSK